MLKKQLAARRRSRFKQLAALYGWLIMTAVLALVLTFGSYAKGRSAAIQRYRDECIGVEKKHRSEFTVLYVDEYRASNCEEAIRLIWGEDAMKPWLAEQEKLEAQP
jgi:hypothetical protein